METTPESVTHLDTYRDQRRRDEIDALNFGTRHKPGELDLDGLETSREDPQ